MPLLRVSKTVGKDVKRMNSEQECIAFSQRLNDAMSAKGYAERERAKVLMKWTGVGREGVRKWLTGMSIPRKPSISELSRHLSCRAEWLEYGDGLMSQAEHLDPEIAESLQLVEERLASASPGERKELFLLIHRLFR